MFAAGSKLGLFAIDSRWIITSLGYQLLIKASGSSAGHLHALLIPLH